ncbi:hypothetical protein H2200_002835 [Cladophialophora chaetospira]|uniref:Sulfite efflux pump SSU1 n=1 Tax=Cladophialophora chaetospira TaxID=386627 RepID=A0AA38XH35_9EURO|nr:hypothetical protein H2200_002835 [Cladophialophora chaetospira]
MSADDRTTMAETDGVQGHGHPDIERKPHTQHPLHRSAFRALVEDFEPIWFTWCMNSGIIAIIAHQLPYQFDGLGQIAAVFWMIDLVLFILFSILMFLKLAMFRKQAYRELVNDVQQLGLLACWPIAWLTIVAFVSLSVSEAHWGGHAFTLVAYVMWWVGAAWIITTTCFVMITLIRRHSVSDVDLVPMVLIPPVGVATLATVGGLFSIYSHAISARLAVPVIIASFFSVGIGLFFATFLYTLLLHRLLVKGFPPPELAASMFLFVGPMGQTATALQLLGSAAHTYGRFAGYHKGTFLAASAAASLDVACILLAMLTSGMGTIWLIIAFWCMGEHAVHRKLSWTPTWNAIIFPTGTLTSSMLMFGIEMDSPFFRTITTIGLLFLVVMWFVNLAGTVWKIGMGQVLIVKDNWRAKQELEEQKDQ